MTNLVVQTTQHISQGKRVVILHELIPNPQFGHVLFVVAFQKKTAAVSEYRRLEQQHSGERGLRDLHSEIDRHNGYIFRKAFHEAIAANRSRIRCWSWKLLGISGLRSRTMGSNRLMTSAVCC